MALRTDGRVVAWGGNTEGQCDVPEAALSGVQSISASGVQTVALREDSGVIGWGNHSMGGLPVPTETQDGVAAIAAGYEFVVALKDDGTVLVWGSNYETQAQSSVVTGKASAIAAGGSATFRQLALPWPSFPETTALAGLSGTDAEPGATPFHDGVPNLLKHAFNLSLATPYADVVFNGIAAGLPEAGLVRNETGSRWRVAFVRRKDPRLTYTPMKSTSLANGSFVPMTGTPLGEDIPGFPAWERATVDEIVDPAITPRIFSRLEVK